MVRFVHKHKYLGTSEIIMRGALSNDYVIDYIRRKKSFYEIDLLEYIDFIARNEPRDNAVAVDVGANIGNHSIYLGKYVAMEVISVEANPLLYEALYENLRNNIHNYSIAECALGESLGRGKIVYPSVSDNALGMATVESLEACDNVTESIGIKTLDSIVEDHKEKHDGRAKISLIKIDVEGAEISVLKGAAKTLKTDHPHLFVEVMKPELKEPIDDYLQQYEYEAISYWAGTPVYHYAHQPTAKLKMKAALMKMKYKMITTHIRSIMRRLQ
ncbi:MAG: FkbM family methyltransferase [Desulfatiglans sp.]|nr:FkbM family methyltransferase [Desulfatiglans sp.]